jgi:UDP-N-acetylmuramoylalanine--D-glutamate ligase
MNLENIKNIAVIGLGRSGIYAAYVVKIMVTNSSNNESSPSLFEPANEIDVLISDSNENVNVKDPYYSIKDRLEGYGIKIELGGHSKKILNADLIIKSPGVPSDIDILKKAKDKSIKIMSEVEFAYSISQDLVRIGQAHPFKLIAVTGTNGKTTTAHLLYHLLSEIREEMPYGHLLSHPVSVGGNIGRPFSELIYEHYYLSRPAVNDIGYPHLNPRIIILELSSFQTEDIEELKPDIALILNIAEDHLDRYSSFDDYCKAKINLLRNMNKDDLILYNHDDKVLLEEIKKIDMPSTSYSLDKEHSQFYFEDNQIKSSSSDECLLVDDCNLKGIHNISNMIAVATVASKLGVDDERILSFMKQYEGLEHRFEFVRELNGVTFINDSKATNVSSVEAAIKSIGKNIVLIMGGLSKDSDFSKISDYNDAIKLIVAYGVAAKEITSSLSSSMRVVEQDKFEDAIKNAFDLAEEGDCVLMSPACASFDQFENYEHRGSFFKDVVNKLS